MRQIFLRSSTQIGLQNHVCFSPHYFFFFVKVAAEDGSNVLVVDLVVGAVTGADSLSDVGVATKLASMNQVVGRAVGFDYMENTMLWKPP